jgi:hypothetical protein
MEKRKKRGEYQPATIYWQVWKKCGIPYRTVPGYLEIGDFDRRQTYESRGIDKYL